MYMYLYIYIYNCHSPLVKRPTALAELRGNDESAPKPAQKDEQLYYDYDYYHKYCYY